MTAENDIVLIHYEDKPLVFARIEAILPDQKPTWYHVRLLMLQVPLQVVTWILREAYIQGESFTMNGKQMRLERVVAPPSDEPEPADRSPAPKTPSATASTDAKVINLADLRKK